ncbi:MAG: hypothetical protein ACOC1F_04405 [Myxococcota bacterium]
MRMMLLLGLVVATTACAHGKDRKPPGQPPTPTTVTREEPGGDAHDPQEAALQRLVDGEWGWRNDKRDVFHFPLSDWPNWRRVRFWGMPAFVGFRYGDAHRAVAALWVRRLREGDPEELHVCLERMEAWGEPIAAAYRTEFKKGETSFASWKSENDVLVQTVDAEVAGIFSRSSYRAVLGVSFGWPRVCVIYGYAFRVGEDAELAGQVRDKYAKEAFSRLTVSDPHRSPDGAEELPLPPDPGPRDTRQGRAPGQGLAPLRSRQRLCR